MNSARQTLLPRSRIFSANDRHGGDCLIGRDCRPPDSIGCECKRGVELCLASRTTGVLDNLVETLGPPSRSIRATDRLRDFPFLTPGVILLCPLGGYQISNQLSTVVLRLP
jgi:hypothetical protein